MMETLPLHIDLLYEESCADDARRISDFLINKGLAAEMETPDQTPSGFVCRHLTAGRRIVTDSALVFVSGEALKNADFLAAIEALPERVRLIPAARQESMDGIVPGSLPKRVEEINFIWLGQGAEENFLDSLTTDPDFYALKNHLMVRVNGWKQLKNESMLLTSLKEIKAYRERVLIKKADVRDPGLAVQISEILAYLDASEAYASRLRRRDAARGLVRAGLIAGCVLIFIGFYSLAAYYRRAGFANIVSSADTDTVDPMTGAIKMTEALTNPYAGAASKKIAMRKLVGFMDETWEQTPIGMNYRQVIRDVAIAPGERYVYSADEAGDLLLWDTYTGQILYEETLAETALIALAADETGFTLAALDAEGGLYLGEAGRQMGEEFWGLAQDKASVSKADFSWRKLSDTGTAWGPGIRLYLEGEDILLLDGSQVLLCNINGDIVSGFHFPEGERCLAGGMDGRGRVCLLYATSGEAVWASLEGGTLADQVRCGVAVGDRSLADMREGSCVLSDADGQVWRIREGRAVRTHLLLPEPIALCLADERSVVYHERNMGTGIYDIEGEFDYGEVLSDFKAVHSLRATPSLLVVEDGTCRRAAALSDILPIKEPEQASGGEERVLTGEIASDDPERYGIRKAEIREEGWIVLSVRLKGADEEQTVVLDPMHVLKDEKTLQELEKGLPDQYLTFEDELFAASGPPTAVGVLPVPAGEKVNRAYDYLLIGCGDGSFFELTLSAEEGAAVITRRHSLPSRCAVTAIRYTGDGYVLTDAAGRAWFCSDGIGMLSEAGICEAVRDKLRSAVTDPVQDLVSKEVWKELGLVRFPGGDGEWWG